jgi:hypothetical protein
LDSWCLGIKCGIKLESSAMCIFLYHRHREEQENHYYKIPWLTSGLKLVSTASPSICHERKHSGCHFLGQQMIENAYSTTFKSTTSRWQTMLCSTSMHVVQYIKQIQTPDARHAAEMRYTCQWYQRPCYIKNPAHLELGLGALARNGALDQTIWIGLRSKHSSILASVLQSLVPAQVCK